VFAFLIKNILTTLTTKQNYNFSMVTV